MGEFFNPEKDNEMPPEQQQGQGDRNEPRQQADLEILQEGAKVFQRHSPEPDPEESEHQEG